MDAWADTVYRIALFHARSVPDAEDITQDVFVRLLKSTLAFEDDDHLKAWLISVTLNRCRETHRTTQRRKTSPVAKLPDTRAAPPADEGLFQRSARFGTRLEAFLPTCARLCTCAMWKAIRRKR